MAAPAIDSVLLIAFGGPTAPSEIRPFLDPGATSRGVLDPLSWLVDLQVERPLRLRLAAELENWRRRAPGVT